MNNLTPITREEMLLNDEPLTPITREEKILAGEDLNPVTRREYFLKKYRHAGGDVMVEGLSVTENGTYTAPEGKAYSPVEVDVPLPENAYLLKTASGSLVSFSDGADLPMPSFVCNIDAVQDLHGYDAPWVGGAGKNKLPAPVSQTKDGITLSIDSEGYIVANGTATKDTVDIYFATNTPIKAGSYKSALIKSDTDNIRLFVSENGAIKNEGIVFTEANDFVIDIAFLRFFSGITYQNVRLGVMVVEATETDPTFAPYSNICPISGHTGVDAVISPTTEASAGTTYSVSWQTEAGEVFGGYVDLVSGVLTVTDGYVDLGTLSWIYDGDGVFRTIALNGSKLDGKSICSNYTQVTASWVNVTNGKYRIGPNDMRICDTNYTDATAFTTAMNGVQLVYELTTPITYQLTPTQIKSLLGNNNAWCDTGEVDVDYFAKEV